MVLLRSLALDKGDGVATELVQDGLGRLVDLYTLNPCHISMEMGNCLGGGWCSSTHLKNEVYY